MTIPFHSAFFDYFTPRFEFVSSIEFHISDFVLPMYIEDVLDYPSWLSFAETSLMHWAHGIEDTDTLDVVRHDLFIWFF